MNAQAITTRAQEEDRLLFALKMYRKAGTETNRKQFEKYKSQYIADYGFCSYSELLEGVT